MTTQRSIFVYPDPATVDVDEATLTPFQLVLFILALYLRADTSQVQPDQLLTDEGSIFPARLEDGTPWQAFVRIKEDRVQVGRVREPGEAFDNLMLWEASQAQEQIAHIEPTALLPVPA